MIECDRIYWIEGWEEVEWLEVTFIIAQQMPSSSPGPGLNSDDKTS